MSAPGTVPGTKPAPDPSELERIAMAALQAGRLLMETGARAEIVHEDSSLVARGLAANHVDVRSGLDWMPVGPLKPLRLLPPQLWAARGECCLLAWVSPALLCPSPGVFQWCPGASPPGNFRSIRAHSTAP